MQLATVVVARTPLYFGTRIGREQLSVVPWPANAIPPGSFRAIDELIKPQGVAVVVEGAHGCMTSRGVHQSASTMVTSRMLGAFRDRPETRLEFLAAINLRG